MIEVSVVVPTYNTGARISALVASMRAQTLDRSRFEVILVDDGSTDDTWQRIQDETRDEPLFRSERIPASGWPGKPRNVGTDLARGRYVVYLDHDDELFPRALERWVAYADQTEADVVIGKEVRSGATTIGSELFWRDLERAHLLEDPVLALITPHKLFRVSFLREQGIRYPEGRRRLEDALFLNEVYTRTDRIAVLASEPCYRWIISGDGSNASSNLGDPAVYFRSVEDLLDSCDAALADGRLTRAEWETLSRFWYIGRVLRRLSWWWFESWDPDYRIAAIATMRELVTRRVPVELDEALTPTLVPRAAFLRGDESIDIGPIIKQQAARRVETTADWEWTEEGLRVTATGVYVDGEGRPVPHEPDFPRMDWHLGRSWVDLGVRHRGSDIEWYAYQPVPLRIVDTPSGPALGFEGSWTIDPQTFALGRKLSVGTWVPFVHARVLEEIYRPRFTGEAPDLGSRPAGRRTATLITKRDRAALQIRASASRA